MKCPQCHTDVPKEDLEGVEKMQRICKKCGAPLHESHLSKIVAICILLFSGYSVYIAHQVDKGGWSFLMGSVLIVIGALLYVLVINFATKQKT